MAMFGTQEWVDLLAGAINGNQKYAEAAADWVGDFYFVVNAGGAFVEPRIMYLNLQNGQCKEAEVVTDPTSRKPEYELKGNMDTWRKIILGETKAMEAIMMGKLSLKGNMGKIVRNANAAQELVNSTKLVPTEFPE